MSQPASSSAPIGPLRWSSGWRARPWSTQWVESTTTGRTSSALSAPRRGGCSDRWPRSPISHIATIFEQTELGFGALCYQALGESAAGKVLVLSSGGYPDASHGGGTKLSRLQNTGAAGVLADGRLRDFEQLGDY